MTEGIAPETSICSERVGVGKGSSTGELVTKFASSGERDEWRVRERSNGVFGAEGVSSGSGLSKSEQKVSPPAVRRSANKHEMLGEMLGETPARCIIRWNAGVQHINK